MAQKYTMHAKSNATCPARAKVAAMIAENITAFKICISDKKLRNRYPVYIDAEETNNLFAFLEKISLNGNVLDEAAMVELIATKPLIKIESVNGMMFAGTIEVEESKNNAVDSTYVSERLQKIMDEKIAAGIVSAEDMKERLEYMQENRVAEPIMYKVVKGYRTYRKAVHKPHPLYVDPFLNSPKKEGIVAEGLRCAVLRMPTICSGEKSVGKNIYIETLAWVMGMPVYMIGFSRNMNPNAIYGEKSTDNSASEKLRSMETNAIAKVMLETNQPFKSNETREKAIKQAADFELNKAMAASVNIITDASELYDWMVDGGDMIFNEANMACANFFSSFANPLTDGTGFLFFPGRGEVKMNKDCVLFTTQNPDYEGVMQQNAATMSRFNTLYFPQPRNVFKLLKAATTAALAEKDSECDFVLPDKYYTVAEQFYQDCMDAVHRQTLSNDVLSIRGFVRALTVVAASEATCNLSRWLEISVIDSCPADEQQTIKDIMKGIVVI